MNSVFPSSKPTQFTFPRTHTHTQGRPCQIEHSEQIGLLFELTAYSCAMLTKEASFVSWGTLFCASPSVEEEHLKNHGVRSGFCSSRIRLLGVGWDPAVTEQNLAPVMQTALVHVFDRTYALLRCTDIFGSLMRLLAVPSSFQSGVRELLTPQPR